MLIGKAIETLNSYFLIRFEKYLSKMDIEMVFYRYFQYKNKYLVLKFHFEKKIK